MLWGGLADGELFEVEEELGVGVALAVSLQAESPKTVSPHSAAATTVRITMLRPLVSMNNPHQTNFIEPDIDAFVNCRPPVPPRSPGRARTAR
jgi:hypothetical protein